MIYKDKWRKLEPFNLIGEYSLFWTKDDAARVAKDNSYYFFVVGILLMSTYIYGFFVDLSFKFPTELVFIYGCLIIIFGILVRYPKSRIASVLLAINFGIVIFEMMIVTGDKTSTIGWISVLLFMASIRSCQATFYYHRKTE